MDTTIRAATEADYPAIDALFIEGDTFHASGAPDVFRPPVSAPARPREVYDRMLDPGHATFVAEREGWVVTPCRIMRDAGVQSDWQENSTLGRQAMA